MLNRPIRQDTDIERIAITEQCPPSLLRGKRSNAFAAIGLGNEPIQGRTDVGVLLRTVNFQVSGDLIDLILQRIRRDYFDEALQHFRNTIARRDAMPGMRFKQDSKQFP